MPAAWEGKTRWDLPSGSFPADARRLDNAAGRIGGEVYSQFGGIQQDGVGRPGQRRIGPAAIPGITPVDVGQDLLEGNRLALGGELAPATLCADLRSGSHEQLGRGPGGDHSADIPAVEHSAAWPARKPDLGGVQGVPDTGVHRHPAGQFPCRTGAKGGIVQGQEIDLTGDGSRCLGIIGIDPGPGGGHADGPVEEASIKDRQAIGLAQPGSDCPLA